MDGPSCAWLALLRDPAVSDRDTAHLKTTAQEAQSLYLKACEFGYGWGCTKLAYDEMYMKSATETNFDRTLELALIGCRDGQNCVEFFQARLKRDHAQLVADHGTVPAALMERYDMVTPSWHGPVRRLRRSCARDVTADCIALGALFDAAGQGDNSKMRYQTPYPEISQALYLHACDLKDGDGCAVLGERLKDGLIRNPERALTYAKRGCDLGSSKACFLAASFYEVYSEYPDRALAYFYTQKACLGDRSLQCQIMHKPGDDARAAKMERRVLGCVHGEATTCFLIAENRFKNSPEMRHDLHQIGCHLGETRSCDALKRIP
ncbi:hypothetical protein [Lentibacter sp. XHP0401]|uniref:hypothetical protein n=1 Tax=Lentibacter sp. XHP0401 TaxID=2984334 RepID=UPI0021E7099A|nr:hypothetical protein [Lentibacter sp. XHP0401]MCV2892759.1 hypothetical protein [Lentibacter sp. XHP0401]